MNFGKKINLNFIQFTQVDLAVVAADTMLVVVVVGTVVTVDHQEAEAV